MKPIVIVTIAFVLLIPFSAFAEVKCPNGSFARVNDFGDTICLDNTKRTPVEPIIIPDEIQINDEQIGYVVIGIIIFIVIIAGIVKASSKSEPKSYKDIPRRNFSSEIEQQTLKNQGNKCNDCQTSIGVVKGRMVMFDYDHIDGNHFNNSPENCQALCKNCHAIKTERERGKHDNFN